MWKKKLNSLTPLSTNLLRRRRRRIRPPSTAAASSSPKFQPQPNSISFSFNSSSSRVFPPPRIHLVLLGVNSNLFRSASSSPAPPPNSHCWNCNDVASTTTPFLVCQSCRSVQPVDPSIDYFQILGVEKKYDVKVENLEGKYKGWQKKLHPDLVHTKSKKEREFAGDQSARITDAYRTLTDPLSRAVYLLKLEGVKVDEEERISDPELLAEIMEIREAVEDAADTQALNRIQAQIQKQLEHWSESFADAFQSRKYEEAISSIQRMTYYKRANEEIIKKL